MKILVDQVRPEGLILEEDFDPKVLELDNEVVRFRGPLKVSANARRVSDVVRIDFTLAAAIDMVCCRCLKDISSDLHKVFTVDYPLAKGQRIIDADADIHDAIILDYPLNPLCKPGCKGICPKCGADLNENNSCKCCT